MVENNNLWEVIEKNINLSPPTPSGWHRILCPICNDSGRKGMRAGFILHPDGLVMYHCFNCPTTATYHPSHPTMQPNMIRTLKAFNVPDIEWQYVVLNNLDNSGVGVSSDNLPEYIDITPSSIVLPTFCYPLTNDPNDEWCQASIEYLASRGVDWTIQPFYCVCSTTPVNDSRWMGRLIIPAYYRGDLIFYQGRDLTDTHIKKYLSPTVARNNILYGYHNILDKKAAPLFVVEGWFDAIHIDGVAVYGNVLTANQIKWLERTNRDIVIVPDAKGDGHVLANQALNLGWKVSLPLMDDQMGDCKDVDDMVKQYGKLFTTRMINQYIISNPTTAQTIINAKYTPRKKK